MKKIAWPLITLLTLAPCARPQMRERHLIGESEAAESRRRDPRSLP